MDRILVSLNQLVINPAINPRHDKDGDVADLVAAISSQGFTDPLWVRPQGDVTGATVYEVIDGKRRRTALAALGWSQPVPVDVFLVDDAAALEMALAAQTAHRDLSPADEAKAFHRLALSGVEVPEIARRFAVSERLVRQRIAIGTLPERILDALRDGTITVATAEAYTLTTSADRQLEVFDSADGGTPWSVRQALTGTLVNSRRDPRAAFVGIEAYEAAGGSVLRDLFSADAMLADAALLQRLYDDKIAATARALKDEGWSFVDLVDSHNKRWAYGSEEAKGKAGADTTAELERLAARRQAVSDEIDRLNEGDDDTTDLILTLDDELEALGDRVADLKASTYSAAQKKRLGAIICTADRVEVLRGLTRPEKVGKQSASPQRQEDDAPGPTEFTPAALAIPSYSDTVEQLLAVAARDAIKLAMATAKPALAARMGLAARLLAFLGRPHDAPFDVSVSNTGCAASFDDIRSAVAALFSPAEKAADASEDAASDDDDMDGFAGGDDFATVLAKLETCEAGEITRLEAILAADLFTVGPSLRSPDVRFVLEQVDPDMRAGFAIDETFLQRLSRQQLDLIAAEITPDTALPKGKKPDMIAAVLPLIRQSGWLPQPLRTPGYALLPVLPAAEDAAGGEMDERAAA